MGRTLISLHRGPQHVTDVINEDMREWCPGRDMVGIPAREAWPDPMYAELQRLMDDTWLTGREHWVRFHGGLYGTLPRVESGVVVGVATVYRPVAARLLELVAEDRQSPDRLPRPALRVS